MSQRGQTRSFDLLFFTFKKFLELIDSEVLHSGAFNDGRLDFEASLLEKFGERHVLLFGLLDSPYHLLPHPLHADLLGPIGVRLTPMLVVVAAVILAFRHNFKYGNVGSLFFGDEVREIAADVGQ